MVFSPPTGVSRPKSQDNSKTSINFTSKERLEAREGPVKVVQERDRTRIGPPRLGTAFKEWPKTRFICPSPSFLMLRKFAQKMPRLLALNNIHFICAGQIRKYAAELLREHTIDLESHDPSKVESVLPIKEVRGAEPPRLCR